MEEIIAGDFGALKRSSQQRSDDDVQASIIAPPNIDTAFPAPPPLLHLLGHETSSPPFELDFG